MTGGLPALGAAGALVLIIAAVWFQSPRPHGGPLRVPTSAQVRPQPAAAFQRSGAVRAVRHGRLVCFETVPGGDRLVFPEGYSASTDLTLLDPSGAVAATPGSAVGVAFSSAAVAVPPECGRGAARAVVRIEGLGG